MLHGCVAGINTGKKAYRFEEMSVNFRYGLVVYVSIFSVWVQEGHEDQASTSDNYFLKEIKSMSLLVYLTFLSLLYPTSRGSAQHFKNGATIFATPFLGVVFFK